MGEILISGLVMKTAGWDVKLQLWYGDFGQGQGVNFVFNSIQVEKAKIWASLASSKVSPHLRQVPDIIIQVVSLILKRPRVRINPPPVQAAVVRHPKRWSVRGHRQVVMSLNMKQDRKEQQT